MSSISSKVTGIVAIVIVGIIFFTSPGSEQIFPIGEEGTIEAMIMLLVMAIAIIYIMEGTSSS